MPSFAAMAGEEPIEREQVKVPKSAVVLPEWLRIKDDNLWHPGEYNWFIVEADFDIAHMPDAVDHEVEKLCGIEKLFTMSDHYLKNMAVPDGETFAKKRMKEILLHKGSLLSREECVLRMVPVIKYQRDLKLGLLPPPPPPPPPAPMIDTSNHYCLFY